VTVYGSAVEAVTVPDGLRVVGVSLGHADDVVAEHWLSSLPEAPVLACTHLMREPYPHVAVSLAVADGAAAPPQGEEVLRPAAAAAADAHRNRRSGRAVIYPGVERLVGVLSVAQVVQLSAIERVQVLGSATEPAPETLLETGDFVRPQWMQGTLTLVATPAAGGRIAPFEVADPTPCCADH
jgi:hypothetical protein